MLQWCSAKQFLKIWHQEKQRWNLLKDNYPVLKKLYCELAKLPCFAVCSCIDRLGRNKGVADWPHTNRLLTDLIFKVLILTENKSDGLCRSIAVKTSVTYFFCLVFPSLFPALATLLCHLLWELILPAIKDQFACLDTVLSFQLTPTLMNLFFSNGWAGGWNMILCFVVCLGQQ